MKMNMNTADLVKQLADFFHELRVLEYLLKFKGVSLKDAIRITSSNRIT